METIVRYPAPVRMAEKFLWEVFLTDKWDHLFVGPNSAHLNVLPRELSFAPSHRTWGRGLSDDLFTVMYEEGNTPMSRVIVGMRANKEDERPGLLWPGTIKFEVFIFSKAIAARVGADMLTTEPIPVWRK